MPTYAAYLRVSSQEQRERQTIQTQLSAINAYALANGIRLKHTFADDGVSGTVPVNERADGARLLQEVERKSFDVLLVFRVDRLSRDTLELLKTVKTLEENGVAVQSITEPFETASPMGKFMLTMAGGMAQMERDALRDRSTAGMRRGASEGRWMGGRAPFGYQIEDKRLVIDDAEAAIVKEVFEKYLSGMTTLQIADLMNARNVPTPRGWRKGDVYKWQDVTVLKILKRTNYKGEAHWNKYDETRKNGKRVMSRRSEQEHIVMPVPALVTPEEFNAVQTRLAENYKFAHRNAHREYTLRGLMRCSTCGKILKGIGGTHWPRYRCSSGRLRGYCATKSLSAPELEEQIWKDLVSFASNPTEMVKTLRRKHKSSQSVKSLSAKTKETEVALKSKADERVKVLSLMRRNVISETEAEKELLSIEREQSALEQSLAELKDRAKMSEKFEQSLASMQEALKQVKRGAKRATPKQQSEIIRRIIKRIMVYPDKIEIEYNVPDGL